MSTGTGTGTVEPPIDSISAFVSPPAVLVAGRTDGPLSGASLAVKDVFDVAGTVTRAGNPTFAAGRPVATTNADAVDALVAAGATVVGKTITDELAYSLAGTNVHDGTPTNVAAPSRIPGGSSAGSAAAVAAGLVDLALGTDTGGSIRVPASYCGVFGWRPTHGSVSTLGVVPLAPSFDTVGLLARDPDVLRLGATELVSRDSANGPSPTRLVGVREAWAAVGPTLAGALAALTESCGGSSTPEPLNVDLDAAVDAFRALQGDEAWRQHGEWIMRTDPDFGPGIAARFAAASRVTAEDVHAATPIRDAVRDAVTEATASGTVLVLPATSGPAPLLTADRAEVEDTRRRTLALTCLAGLAGAPVVVAPWLPVGELPVGVAFVGAPGSDLELLDWMCRLPGCTGG